MYPVGNLLHSLVGDFLLFIGVLLFLIPISWLLVEIPKLQKAHKRNKWNKYNWKTFYKKIAFGLFCSWFAISFIHWTPKLTIEHAGEQRNKQAIEQVMKEGKTFTPYQEPNTDNLVDELTNQRDTAKENTSLK